MLAHGKEPCEKGGGLGVGETLCLDDVWHDEIHRVPAQNIWWRSRGSGTRRSHRGQGWAWQEASVLSLMPYAEPSSPCITKRAGMSPICTPCFGAVTSRSLPEEAPGPPPWMPAAYLRRYCTYVSSPRPFPAAGSPTPPTRRRPRPRRPRASLVAAMPRCGRAGACVQVERTLTEKSSWDPGVRLGIPTRVEVCRGGKGWPRRGAGDGAELPH